MYNEGYKVLVNMVGKHRDTDTCLESLFLKQETKLGMYCS